MHTLVHDQNFCAAVPVKMCLQMIKKICEYIFVSARKLQRTADACARLRPLMFVYIKLLRHVTFAI